MQNTTHTPGPWFVTPSSFDRPAKVKSSHRKTDWTVADVYSHDCSKDTTEANARLIASAPELLAALEAAHNQVVLMFCEEFAATLSADRRESIKTTLAVSRAAIARATTP